MKFSDENIFIFQFLHIIFTMHLSVLMLNFLIALLSNSLATVLKDKESIMTVQKLNVIQTAEFRLFYEFPSLARLYYLWIIPKYYIVKKNKVYLTRTVVAKKAVV